jgi:hypothetical protein
MQWRRRPEIENHLDLAPNLNEPDIALPEFTRGNELVLNGPSTVEDVVVAVTTGSKQSIHFAFTSRVAMIPRRGFCAIAK